MKLAISGKGGVGKTLLSALMARAFAAAGYAVTAIDADPDANLGLTLGFPDTSAIVPIAEMKDLIQERTETQPGQGGLYFKINPRVDDIPEKYSLKQGNISACWSWVAPGPAAPAATARRTRCCRLLWHTSCCRPKRWSSWTWPPALSTLTAALPGGGQAHHRGGARAGQHRDRPPHRLPGPRPGHQQHRPGRQQDT